MPLQFSIGTRDRVTTVRLSGTLTLGPQLTRFAREVSVLLESQKISGIVLDLGDVESIDSAGLGELVILYTGSNRVGSRLCLSRVPARVRRLLEMTLLAPMFPQFEDEQSAADWIVAVQDGGGG